MAHELFVDTSGFYALLVKRDHNHREATRVLRSAKETRRRFVTTDYVLDETATLLKARGFAHLLDAFFERVLPSQACRIEWTDSQRFGAVREFFLKHRDHAWSFTDCISFHVMRELQLDAALTSDAHFLEAGYEPLLSS
jgi:predicted nucleic acid-binding protein